MTEINDDRPRPKPTHALGEALDTVSIAEIDARIGLLREEISRLEAAREKKRAAQAAADAVFRNA
jgi:uncharacterized small protein (DUF1192 family)